MPQSPARSRSPARRLPTDDTGETTTRTAPTATPTRTAVGGKDQSGKEQEWVVLEFQLHPDEPAHVRIAAYDGMPRQELEDCIIFAFRDVHTVASVQGVVVSSSGEEYLVPLGAVCAKPTSFEGLVNTAAVQPSFVRIAEPPPA